MQIFHFLFLHAVCFLLCASFNVNAQRKQFNISLGSSLAPTTSSSWLSRSGLYAFGFYPQGKAYAVGIFLAGIPEKTVVWTANRDDPPVSGNASLLLNTEGRLVLQSARGQETPVVAQGEVAPASYASMLDSGNFVLHNSSGGIIWQSFDHPTDTILTGQSLLNGQELVSNVSETDHSTGRFFLAMQGDGNLVQYPVEKIAVATAYWASGTVGWGADVRLSLDSDGHLYLHNSTGFSIMNLTAGIPTGRAVYFMKIDWDGIFRLYSHNLTQNNALSILWESSTDKCQPKGQCGFNSYCIVNPNQQPGCRCLPGFVYVDRENLYSGCKRNCTAERFINSHGTVIYSTQEVEINVFEDVPFPVLQKTKDECKQACLEDSICEAALFNINGQCSMQRLPLRFAQRDESNIVFVKVYDPVSSTGDRPHLRINEGKKYLPMDMIIIVSSLFVAVILVIVAVFGIVIYKCHVWSYGRILDEEFCEDIAPIIFSYQEIEKLTDCFKEEIGRGSSGTVYKGTIVNRQKFVTVKRLDNVLAEGEREFLTEIKVIGRTHHRNLVHLLGYSFDGPDKVLVYEYMSNGSLADILFAPEKQCNWIKRMDIARDIARGILYLHDECETRIIHCDIKPQNILMDDSKCAKISDFGLAKLMKLDQTKTFTGIRGTRGYVAPEWHRKLPVTVKVDVYSFGIALLQIICCRRSIDQNLPEDQVILADWAYQGFDSRNLSQLIGDEEVELKQLERIVKIALWCIIDEPSFRPSMKKVLLMLEGTVDIPIPPYCTSYLASIELCLDRMFCNES